MKTTNKTVKTSKADLLTERSARRQYREVNPVPSLFHSCNCAHLGLNKARASLSYRLPCRDYRGSVTQLTGAMTGYTPRNDAIRRAQVTSLLFLDIYAKMVTFKDNSDNHRICCELNFARMVN